MEMPLRTQLMSVQTGAGNMNVVCVWWHNFMTLVLSSIIKLHIVM